MLFDTFIPTELAVAPNPLGLTCNLMLKAIPIDADNAFELWSPIPKATLLPEEATLLKNDRTRLEAICVKLIWLLNATCIVDEALRPGHTVYQWQDVVNAIRERGFRLDAIEVTHLPQTICQVNSASLRSPSWMIQPDRWQFSFLELNPTETGFQPRAIPVSLLVSFGKTVTKAVEGIAA